MKPKEFIEKYHLAEGWAKGWPSDNKRRQKQFITDMTSELLAMLEYNKAQDNIKGFDNAVNAIKSKWDGIDKKIPYGLPEKLWGFFFATVVAPLREEFCPRQMEQRRQEAAERRAEWQKRKEMRDWWKNREREFIDDWNRSFYYSMLARLLALEAIPNESFAALELPNTATVEEINKAYRVKAAMAHPDHGGSQEAFITLTEHKNKCLAWATKQA